MKLKNIITDICNLENISEDTFKKYIKSFEKYIKSETKKYEEIDGLEDIKMNKYDYNILFELYNKTGPTPFKLHILLLYMYSFYKLDGINFNTTNFPLKLFLSFIKKNDNIHSLTLRLVTSENN